MRNMAAHTSARKVLFKSAHMLLPLVLLTGFFTAGTLARVSCNTFPFVGPHWFLKSNHLNKEIPFWKNFTENKLVVQVTHRTLASLFVILSTV